MALASLRSSWLVLLALIIGCGPIAQEGISPPGCEEGDGGACLEEDAGAEPDPVELDGGSGFQADPGTEPMECLLLEGDVCGTGDPPECADSPGCAAARLLRRYEPGQCGAALDNDVTYPTCQPGVCALLVDKVCGGPIPPAACEEASGCAPARELWRRSNEGTAEERRDAESSCGAALEDEVVFAACP